MDPPPPLKIDEDPWFATRVAFGTTLAFVAAMAFDVVMPMLPAVITSSLMATSRGAMDLKKVIGGGVIIPLMTLLSAFVVQAIRGEMLVFLTFMIAITFFAMLVVMKTGQRMGLMLVIFPHLLGMLGVTSDIAMEAMRDGFVAAGLIAIPVIMLSYLLFRPRTSVAWQEVATPPAFDKPWLEAALRTVATAPVLIAFYLWVDPSNIIYAVMVIMVLVYPNRHQQRREAMGRFLSTITGGAVALLMVGVVTLQPTIPVTLIALFLGCLWFGWRMVSDPERLYTHQIAMTVFISVGLGALGTLGATGGTDPFTSTVQRLMLTAGGVLFALIALYLLRWLFARETFHDVYPRRWSTANASR